MCFSARAAARGIIQDDVVGSIVPVGGTVPPDGEDDT